MPLLPFSIRPRTGVHDGQLREHSRGIKYLSSLGRKAVH